MPRTLRLTLLASATLSGLTLAGGREFVLSDTVAGTRLENWSMQSQELDVAAAAPFSIEKRVLHGGRQEGVEVIEVNNGRLRFTVVPTRGMSIYRVEADDVSLGWDSPVKEMVNPTFINLESREGLGWLDGFNEFLVRCGVEWAGHPGMDEGKLLTLHGRAGNIPASKVVVVVDDAPPHRIRVRGLVVEQTFKFSDLELWTEVSTEPGSSNLRVSDIITNCSDYEREFQIIYHGNLGPPLLEEGSRFSGAVKQVAPFDDNAAEDLEIWAEYLGPTRDYGEQVYLLENHAEKNGFTIVMLENEAGDRGVRIRYNVSELPYFTLWKNTDTLKEEYVTGLEPGTGFPYTRAIERKSGRVPTLRPGESRSFQLDYTILTGPDEIAAVATEIAAIQDSRPTRVISEPPVANIAP